ncbi:hypothetical protein V1525DRAFT_375341 [Lipomyces kononenkoae]|uniref:Uncharacterized protein n=1 Tax=Lipomyces kononenkoae TaxID=34357 RepID=A0ACC3T3V0_LIPKO
MTAIGSSPSQSTASPSPQPPPPAHGLLPPQRPQPPPDPNPPIAEYPILAVRRQLPPSLWASCLDCWCAMTEYFIAQPQTGFERASHLIRFLQTYVSLSRDTDTVSGTEPVEDGRQDFDEIQDPMARLLRRNVFLLLYRQYCLSSHVSNLDMLWGFVRLYARGNHAAIHKVIKHLGFAAVAVGATADNNVDNFDDADSKRRDIVATDGLRAFVLDRIESGKFTVEELHAVQILLRDKQIATAWVTPQIWFARLKSIVSTASPHQQLDSTSSSSSPSPVSPAEIAIKVAYISFVALATAKPDACAKLFDYLRTQLPPPQDVTRGELLPALVVRTKIIGRLRQITRSDDGQAALDAVIIALDTIKLRLPPATVSAISACFRKSTNPKTRGRRAKRRIAKMKNVDAIANVLDIDDANKVKDIKEIFPHLAEKYIVTLLAAKNNSVEEALAYLVDQATDKAEWHHEIADEIASLKVKPVDDNDDDNNNDEDDGEVGGEADDEEEERRKFDNLQFEPGSVYYGRRHRPDADDMLAQGTTVSDKQKIFDSLRVIYDEDEDERDDTYDDVDALAHVYEDPEMDYKDKDEQAPSSAPSSSSQTGEVRRPPEKNKAKPWENKKTKKEIQQLKDEQEYRSAENPNEHYLWAIYSGDKFVFETNQRGTKFRSEMKNRTNWTDEQLEGWAKILDRDPKFRKRMEAKYIFADNRPIVTSAAYNEVVEQYEPDSEPEYADSDNDSDNDAAPTKNLSRQREILPVYQIPTEPKPEKIWGGKAEKKRLERLQVQQERDRRLQALINAGRAGRGGVGYGTGRGGGWAHANHNRRDARTKKMQRGMGNPEN